MRITMQLHGFDWSALSTSTAEALRTAFAFNIASTCGVGDSSIVDVYGSEASVTLDSNGELIAFVLADTGYTATELQSILSSVSFRKLMADAVVATLRSSLGSLAGSITFGGAVVASEHFEALLSTSRESTGGSPAAFATSATTTSTTMGISSAAASSPAVTSASAAEKHTLFGVPAWVWFAVATVLFAGFFLGVHRVYVIMTRRQPKDTHDEESGAPPHSPQPTSQHGLPVLLGSGSAQGANDKDCAEAASTASGDQTHGSLRASDFLRTTLNNVEEGDLWDYRERPEHDCMKTDYDCTKGCNVSCW